MSRKSKRRKYLSGIERRTSPGAPPGSLVVDPQAPLPIIRVITYGSEAVHEELVEDVSRIGNYLGKQPVTWVNVDGLGDATIIRKLGEMFGIHRLALEDIINSHQRAKVDQYGNHLFIVGRMVEMVDRVETEQLSLFLGKDYVLTFQERVGDAFDPVRERIRKSGGRVRNAGPDYLAYALIDAFIDNYFPVLEKYGERLESIEEEVLSRPEPVLVSRMHEVKRDLLTLRRAIWPLRETVNSLVREPSLFISDETRVYFRDCYDHTIQIIDLLENYRDVASGLMEVYLSSASNRLNEIMKILTMFTAFFIPLSLIAGIYGMNFNTARSPFNMPELNWYLGYPFVLGLMAAVALGMVTFFRRKGWLHSRLGSRESETRD
jgi:magnesium transporter